MHHTCNKLSAYAQPVVNAVLMLQMNQRCTNCFAVLKLVVAVAFLILRQSLSPRDVDSRAGHSG
jgi:hypothetical protein